MRYNNSIYIPRQSDMIFINKTNNKLNICIYCITKELMFIIVKYKYKSLEKIIPCKTREM